MKIFNTLDEKKEIDSLDKWFEYCPPQKGEKQWKDLHSAKEMAKFWLDKNNREDFMNFIQKVIPGFTCDYIIPEFESSFDRYASPRKHDLFIAGTNNRAIITIEGKANENFGNDDFGNEFINAIKRKAENKNSHKLDRIINLYLNYFQSNSDIFPIMYQLLYWFAGSFIDAIKEDSDNFIMVLQEFKNERTDIDKINKNHNDFDRFINFISEGKYKHIENMQILGPIVNTYTDTKDVEKKNLYIGYYSINSKG